VEDDGDGGGGGDVAGGGGGGTGGGSGSGVFVFPPPPPPLKPATAAATRRHATAGSAGGLGPDTEVALSDVDDDIQTPASPSTPSQAAPHSFGYTLNPNR